MGTQVYKRQIMGSRTGEAAMADTIMADRMFENMRDKRVRKGFLLAMFTYGIINESVWETMMTLYVRDKKCRL